MSPTTIAILAALNVLIIFLLLAAPIGVRKIRLSRNVNASPERIWSAVWPLGENALWSGSFLEVQPAGDAADRVRVKLNWSGHDGNPIERTLRFVDMVPGERFTTLTEDDSSLHQEFWLSYREDVVLTLAGEGTLVTFERTDRYRGAAFWIFRYFVMRREMSRLKSWAERGTFRKSGIFERPSTQFGFAILSTFILWPFFGLNLGGFFLAAILTAVVALHELGHMAAFRVMGHKSVRMIFIPLLGGIAIGGRPYNTRFEVAFVALMGAGFSAFLVPIAIGTSEYLAQTRVDLLAMPPAAFAGFLAVFNVANLVPVWKFDGGQVLRQICPNSATLAVASFLALGAFLALGYAAGLSPMILIVAGALFAVLSLITKDSGVKLKHELKAISSRERITLAAAFTSVFFIHGAGVIWAADMLENRAEYRFEAELQRSVRVCQFNRKAKVDEAGNPIAGDAAGNDAGEMGQIWLDIERDAMKAHPAP